MCQQSSKKQLNKFVSFDAAAILNCVAETPTIKFIGNELQSKLIFARKWWAIMGLWRAVPRFPPEKCQETD